MFNLYKEKKISFFLLVGAVILSLIGLIFYIVSQNIMNAKLSVFVMIVGILNIALISTIIIYKDFDSIISIIASALLFLTLLLVLSSQFGNLGYYFAGIKDIGYGIMPTFIISFIAYLISIILTSITIFKK